MATMPWASFPAQVGLLTSSSLQRVLSVLHEPLSSTAESPWPVCSLQAQDAALCALHAWISDVLIMTPQAAQMPASGSRTAHAVSAAQP